MTANSEGTPFPPPLPELKTPKQKAGELRDKVIAALLSSEDIRPIHFVESVQSEEHSCFMSALGVLPPVNVLTDDELVLSNSAKGLWRQTVLGVTDIHEQELDPVPYAYSYYTKPIDQAGSV